MKFLGEDTFTNQLPADKEHGTRRRQVIDAFYSYVTPKQTAQPRLLHVSDDMMDRLGIGGDEVKSKDFLEVMTGNKIAVNSRPYAMAYAGHQFGNWAGQLGDGRAINLGEIRHLDTAWVVQLKGAGETPYSRTADGFAVLRSSIREYLCSEAMHHLGVPTTRALSLSLTGDEVLRDVMYNGNAALEKGAIVSRVAPSFVRFGNFELFAARKDIKNLKLLADYVLRNFFPELGAPSKEAYRQFFDEVVKRTCNMIVQWQRVGFVHGVMNTDNMSILGLTIDYGPYGWLEGFDFGWTPNTTDREQKRYRFGNQPNIALWNLYQLANALFPLIEDVEILQKSLNSFSDMYDEQSLQMMRSKLGLEISHVKDKAMIDSLFDQLLLEETDMTIFFRNLSQFDPQNPGTGITIVSDAFYSDDLSHEIKDKWHNWFRIYGERLTLEQLSNEERAIKMNRVNPKYVLRNYMAQLAIDQADLGKYEMIDELYKLLKNPYKDQPDVEKWFSKRPEWARHKVGCSMLSCSS